MIRGVCAAACLIAGPAAVASVTYTFESDAQGWSTLNDARDFTWDSTVGQAPGAIRARDVGDGRIWYFAAPVVDLMNASSYYGGAIAWDILGIQGSQTSIPDRADVMLSGAGMTLGIDIDVQPVNGQWTSWSADVTESAGWSVVSSAANGTLSGTAATEADLRAVLADLDGLYIRGEYTNGADQTAIDNVSIVPAPGAVALLGLSGVAVLRRRR